ncbi:BED zinc finger [Prunus dulcis]|uniref:BED zinc finger n=2 Tax=Prunus dulcis TaxID=3755 RepID=A0A4Y1QRJ4_PRUDU|nr:BED zinc finger [Prunus dulcis]BBN67366.1 BED zinc finger [Prunus dulcis]BBN68269.1 BED zinc finger [Prunus dulcis]
MKTKQRLLLFLSISASPLRLPIYHKSLGNTPNYKNPKSVLEDPYSIIKTQNLCWRHLNSLRTINSFVLLLLRYLYLAAYELSLILQNWIYKILPSMFKLGDKKEDSVQLNAPFKFDVPSPDDLVSNGLWSSRTGSKDYIDFGEHYDNNFEHLNPDDMPNNENNLTSNDMEQPMHANMPLESNTQEENIDQTEGSIAVTSDMWDGAIFGMLASKGKQKSVISSRTEVFKYLDTEFVEFMTEEERNNFNILDWWKAHEKNFPVLSIMARDVLTTPVSTVASESAFSAGGRVLDEKRTRLTPQICEALMCLKDWEDADFRTQSFVDEDLSYFEDDSTSSLNEEREMTNADILPSVLD